MKKNNVLMIIGFLIMLFVVGVYYFGGDTKEETVVKKEESKYELLNDYSDFFTVNSCVTKYITYVSSNKVTDILNILDEKYKSKNNLNVNNIYNYINRLSGNYTFQALKIYYKDLNKNFTEYLVYGKLMQETIDGVSNAEDYYVIVNLDTKQHVFSITPYDGKFFKEVK